MEIDRETRHLQTILCIKKPHWTTSNIAFAAPFASSRFITLATQVGSVWIFGPLMKPHLRRVEIFFMVLWQRNGSQICILKIGILTLPSCHNSWLQSGRMELKFRMFVRTVWPIVAHANRSRADLRKLCINEINQSAKDQLPLRNLVFVRLNGKCPAKQIIVTWFSKLAAKLRNYAPKFLHITWRKVQGKQVKAS